MGTNTPFFLAGKAFLHRAGIFYRLLGIHYIIGFNFLNLMQGFSQFYKVVVLLVGCINGYVSHITIFRGKLLCNIGTFFSAILFCFYKIRHQCNDLNRKRSYLDYTQQKSL